MRGARMGRDRRAPVTGDGHPDWASGAKVPDLSRLVMSRLKPRPTKNPTAKNPTTMIPMCPARIACRIIWLFLSLIVAAGVSPALARELRIHSFHAEIVALPDSSLDVTETIEVEFIGSWQGLYRTIPVEYPGPGGFNYSLFLTDASATAGSNGSGAPLKIEKSRQGPNLEFRIYVPGAADTRRTLSLHYRVRNGLRYFDDHDELYWNVTGSDWTVPIGSASAHVVLPAGVTGARAAQYTGAYGSRAQEAQVEILGSNVTVRTLRALAYREGLTVAVGWDKGFVREPSRSELTGQFLQSNWPLFTPVAAFGLMYWVWYKRGRDPRVGSVAVQYEPPAGLTPGEVGALVDDAADMRDITASIVDLAVRGYLVIEERKKEQLLGLYSTQDFAFILQKKPAQWAGAKTHELLLLAGLFNNGTRDYVEMSDLQNRFYKHLPGIRSAMFDSLVGHGFYAHRPDTVRQIFVGGGLVAGVLVFGAGQYAAQTLGMQTQPFIIAAILTAAAVCGFGWFMPARTMAGARARLNVLGFEDFLSRVEAGRMERMPQTPQTFEKYLPFAMALGVEKNWVTAFDGVCKEPPSWYHSPLGSTFRPVFFANSLSNMSARAGQMMTSAPRGSSGSSGFGGGGRSGGGFGGGGGGGF